MKASVKKIFDMTVDKLKSVIHEVITEDMEAWRDVDRFNFLLICPCSDSDVLFLNHVIFQIHFLELHPLKGG